MRLSQELPTHEQSVPRVIKIGASAIRYRVSACDTDLMLAAATKPRNQENHDVTVVPLIVRGEELADNQRRSKKEKKF
jgi:hypothetical protein